MKNIEGGKLGQGEEKCVTLLENVWPVVESITLMEKEQSPGKNSRCRREKGNSLERKTNSMGRTDRMGNIRFLGG